MRKNISLIGGSHGIGFEIAFKLYDDHNIFIASRSSERLDNLELTHIPYDTSTEEIDIYKLPNHLDGYCPGTINLKPFKILSPEVFLEDMQINFMFLIKAIQSILSLLKKSEQASLIFFSTVVVKIGMPFYTNIAAVKDTIESFAKALVAEYAPKFRVNVIAPSLTNTSLAEKLLSNEKNEKKWMIFIH